MGTPLSLNSFTKFKLVSKKISNFSIPSSEKKFSGEVFNVGNGSNTSVNELVEMLGGKKGKGKKVIEPFETLANTEKIHAAVGWTATGNLKVWISNYRKELNI